LDYKANKKPGKPGIGYNVEDPSFLEVVRSIILSTYSIFRVQPSDDECEQLYKRINNVQECGYIPSEKMNELKARLIAAEQNLPLSQRTCIGDRDEIGLIQFAQAIMDIDSTRRNSPTHVYQQSYTERECLIPFSQEIKFNLFIRDMNTSV